MVEILELYNTLYKVTEKLIDTLKRDGYHERHYPLIEAKMESFVLDEHGKWSIGEVPRENLRPPASDYTDHILSMDETEKLFDILLAKGFIEHPKFVDSEGNPVEKPSKRNILWSGCLHGGVFSFIGQYLMRIPRLDFDPDMFDHSYSDFERYHLLDEILFTSVIPLLHFSSDEDLIQFDEAHKIVRLQRTEIARLGSYMPMVFMRDPNSMDLETVASIFASDFAIKIVFSLRKDEPISDKFAYEQARRILTAFRILKSGDPFWNITFTEPVGFHPTFAGPTIAHTVPLLPVQRKESFRLSVEDCAVCKDVWQKLQRLSRQEDRGKLDVGIRKFNDIYGHKFLEDKIIDMSILLESTLLYGDDKELGYRLSLRGAHLLKSNRDPMETFIVLKKFYNLRGGIVHKGKRLSSPISVDKRPFRPDEFVAEMESVCREVLRTFMEKVAGGVSISDVNKDLDKEALRP
jgi:hypothetical protein